MPGGSPTQLSRWEQLFILGHRPKPKYRSPEICGATPALFIFFPVFRCFLRDARGGACPGRKNSPHAEEAKEPGKYTYLIEFSPESIVQEARILSLSDQNDGANQALHHGELPGGASLLGVGTTVLDLVAHRDKDPNVLFVSPSCPHAATVLPEVLEAIPSIKWVHVRSAGIDFVESDPFIDIVAERELQVTNAKGQFSSSLAEVRCACCLQIR